MNILLKNQPLFEGEDHQQKGMRNEKLFEFRLKKSETGNK